jgi:hypothetical protein
MPQQAGEGRTAAGRGKSGLVGEGNAREIGDVAGAFALFSRRGGGRKFKRELQGFSVLDRRPARVLISGRFHLRMKPTSILSPSPRSPGRLRPALALASAASAGEGTGSWTAVAGSLGGLLLGVIQLVVGLSLAAFSITRA